MIDNLLVVGAVVHPRNMSPGNQNPESPETLLDGVRPAEGRQATDRLWTSDRILEHKLDFHPSRY